MENNKKEPITEETVIGSQKITAAEFRRFFKKTLGEDYEKNAVFKKFIKIPLSHKGKTLREIIAECNSPVRSKSLKEILAENRFKIISTPDKAFILAFEKAMNEMGYDFGGDIVGNKDLMVIGYGKTGTKTRLCPACFLIYDNGNICLKLYLHKVDDHRQYVENAPAHIRELFTNDIGKCNGCNFRNGKCKYNCTKTYTIGGRLFNKCYFELTNLMVENISDYMALLAEFYPTKKPKSAK